MGFPDEAWSNPVGWLVLLLGVLVSPLLSHSVWWWLLMALLALGLGLVPRRQR